MAATRDVVAQTVVRDKTCASRSSIDLMTLGDSPPTARAGGGVEACKCAERVAMVVFWASMSCCMARHAVHNDGLEGGKNSVASARSTVGGGGGGGLHTSSQAASVNESAT